MKKEEILKLLGPLKEYKGYAKDEDGSKTPVTLYWYDSGWRTLDYLRPLALKKKVHNNLKQVRE